MMNLSLLYGVNKNNELIIVYKSIIYLYILIYDVNNNNYKIRK